MAPAEGWNFGWWEGHMAPISTGVSFNGLPMMTLCWVVPLQCHIPKITSNSSWLCSPKYFGPPNKNIAQKIAIPKTYNQRTNNDTLICYTTYTIRNENTTCWREVNLKGFSSKRLVSYHYIYTSFGWSQVYKFNFKTPGNTIMWNMMDWGGLNFRIRRSVVTLAPWKKHLMEWKKKY